MKKIIDGKMYNTETAEELASYSRGYQCDFKHYEETLYRTKNGAIFLAGEGGPSSKYRKPTYDGNGMQGGCDIFLLDDSQAKQWLEEHDEFDVFERLFGINEG